MNTKTILYILAAYYAYQNRAKILALLNPTPAPATKLAGVEEVRAIEDFTDAYATAHGY